MKILLFFIFWYFVLRLTKFNFFGGEKNLLFVLIDGMKKFSRQKFYFRDTISPAHVKIGKVVGFSQEIPIRPCQSIKLIIFI